MPRNRLDSMLLASTDPDRLADWYAAAFEPDVDDRMDDYRVQRYGRFYVMFDRRDDVGAVNPEPARMIHNLDVADLRAVAARLDEAGATWLAPPEDRDGSLFATVVDPDGSYVQLVQLSPEALAEMADPEVTTGFGATDAFGSFSVDDLAAARTFYADTLGLAVEEDGPVLRLELGPDRTVVLYPKADHVPAGFTVLNFAVHDLEATVADLAGRGVTFERYDAFVQDEHGIARGDGGPPIAWFTDPAGNVLAVLEDGAT